MATRNQSRALTDAQARNTARLLAAHGQPRRGWYHDADCTDLHPDEFFGYITTKVRDRCAGCPVRVDCLADAMPFAGYNDEGFRAGTYPEDRAKIAEAMP